MTMLMACALVLTVQARQIGLISRRLADGGHGGGAVGLAIGEGISTADWLLADGSGSTPSRGQIRVLLFASFSCGACRGLLEELRRADSQILSATIFMLLDTGPWNRFAGDIEQFGLTGLPVVFASGLAEEFRISQTPQVYVVDAGGTVVAAGRAYGVKDFLDLVRPHLGRRDLAGIGNIKEISYVNA